MIERVISITVWGETEKDVNNAFDEAVERLRAGCTSGSDEDDGGGFFFENTSAG